MFHLQAQIITLESPAPGYFRMKLAAPEIAREAQPGQFVELGVAGPDFQDPLLKRPFSLYRIDQAQGTITILLKVVGRGSTLLAAKRPGESVMVIGPIGKGFAIPRAVKELALIAGGVGMPPLFCLAEELHKQGSAPSMTLFYGAAGQGDLVDLDLWQQLGVTIHRATEDGSQGFKGLVTEVFQQEYQRGRYDFLAACGPVALLAAVQHFALKNKTPGQISMESRMACGIGACLGCVCQTKQGYQRVCVDGPVFSLGEVVLE